MNSIDQNLIVSTDQQLMDQNFIINYLKTSYWAKDRTVDSFMTSFKHSLCFGLFLDGVQIGFARAVTDVTVFAYLMDFFVVESHKGLGYGSFLLDQILRSPELVEVERFRLATRDAHEFYRKKGFDTIPNPENLMEKIKI